MRGTLSYSDKLVGLTLTFIGVCATLASFWIPLESDGSLGARIFPLIAGLMLSACGALELLKTQKKVIAPDVAREDVTAEDHPGRVLILFIIAIAYVWLISKFGFLVATAPVSAVVMWMFGVRNPIALIITALLCPIAYHLIFFTALGVFPPLGDWFDLTDVMNGV